MQYVSIFVEGLGPLKTVVSLDVAGLSHVHGKEKPTYGPDATLQLVALIAT